jgi:hypothetical protein
MQKRGLVTMLILFTASALIYFILVGFIRWDYVVLFVLIEIVLAALYCIYTVWRLPLNKTVELGSREKAKRSLREQSAGEAESFAEEATQNDYDYVRYTRKKKDL